MALKTGALSFLRETFLAFLRLPTSLSGPRPFLKLQTHICPQGTHDWPLERREITEPNSGVINMTSIPSRGSPGGHSSEGRSYKGERLRPRDAV